MWTDESGWAFLLGENMFEGLERKAASYCRWLLALSDDDRLRHQKSLNDMYYAVDNYRRPSISCLCKYCREFFVITTERYERECNRTPHPPRERKVRITRLYLMRNQRNGLTKIGHSSDPLYREKTLQSEEPEVTMLFSFPANPLLESELHRRFAQQRVRGEWFKLEDADIESVRAAVQQ